MSTVYGRCVAGKGHLLFLSALLGMGDIHSQLHRGTHITQERVWDPPWLIAGGGGLGTDCAGGGPAAPQNSADEYNP